MITFIIEICFDMYRIDNENNDPYATRNPRGVVINGKVYYMDRVVPAPSKKHAKTADDFARIAHNEKVARQTAVMRNASKIRAKARLEKRYKTNAKHAEQYHKDQEALNGIVDAQKAALGKQFSKDVQTARKEQKEKVYNAWHPTLLGIDAVANTAGMIIPGNPYVLGASLLTNGLQVANDMFTGENPTKNLVSIGTDIIGGLGKMNVLPKKIKFRNKTIHPDTYADGVGYLGNIRDLVNDVREGINTKYDPFNFTGGIGFKPFAPRYYFK